ncbi:proline-rich receptor-like protein kinase PERK13 isoform X2 [Ricinus communis]|uniref:proline-rich receptor-like protein kinase PERK13 isoform X2 n=1 Tax=Ricinus communis TaxID=3988 RepID=UPI00201B1EE9|nr:proline-rich receptor-like protein kinase PERK13 isoform X2 [Ricinus communis]
MSKPYAAIVGGAVGVALVAAFIILWFFKSHCKNFSNKNSETGSSDPSALEWSRGGRSSSAPSRYIFGSQGARQFTMDELEQATKQFSDSNLIGYGSFGSVYKGLLHDSVVAIKRRPNVARDDFVAEVTAKKEDHRCWSLNMYPMAACAITYTQFILLTDRGLESSTKLEFKQRLSIALGAAKGLCHLHSLNPPLVHKNFRMANVLVDENFIVKVADAGISKLLEKIEEAGPSFTSGVNVFQDPETEVSGTFTEMSDVYSFGVFLLELLTGQEAVHLGFSGTDESLIQWVASRLNSNSFVDRRLMGSFTRDGIRDLIRLTLRCMSFPGTGRPKMEMVVAELERIHDREMELTTVMGEGTATFLKGSELFT